MYKYQKIAEELKEQIISGAFLDSKKIPDEKTLAQQFDVSRMTIKQSIDLLINQGILTRSKGSGTFIRGQYDQKRKDLYSNQPNQFGFYNSFKNEDTENIIKKFTIEKADKNIARKLNIDENDFIYTIERIHKINDIPIIYEEIHLPIELIGNLKEEDIKPSLYNYLEDNLKIKLFSADKKIRAQLPNQKIQTSLNINKNQPIIEIEHVVYSATGEAVEHAIISYRGDKYEFSVISQNINN